jgi:hypothetical protein
MSGLFLLAKGLELVEAQTKERDKFWIRACESNKVDFAQIRNPGPFIDNSTLGTSETLAMTNINGQHDSTTGSAISGPLLPKTNGQHPQAPGANTSDKASKTFDQPLFQVSGREPWNTIGGIHVSTTIVDKSRDPRLHHGSPLKTVSVNPTGKVSEERRLEEDRQRSSADRGRSDADSAGGSSLFQDSSPIKPSGPAAGHGNRLSPSQGYRQSSRHHQVGRSSSS